MFNSGRLVFNAEQALVGKLVKMRVGMNGLSKNQEMQIMLSHLQVTRNVGTPRRIHMRRKAWLVCTVLRWSSCVVCHQTKFRKCYYFSEFLYSFH
jgi:hypothetical protein